MPSLQPDLSAGKPAYVSQAASPVRFDWLLAVARVAGRSKAVTAANLLAWLASQQSRPDVKITRHHMTMWTLSRDAFGDALRLLQAHRMVLVWWAPGRARIVVLTEPGSTTPLVIS